MKNKPGFNRFVVICLLLFFLLAFSTSAFANSSLQRARDSVVRVIVIDPATGQIVNFGSGFVVGDGDPFKYVATCGRIIEQGGDIYIWRAKDDRISAEVYQIEGDIALLELDPRHQLHGYEPVELARKEMVSDADRVYAIGFPIASDEMVDFPAAFPEDSTISDGIVEKGVTIRGVGAYQTNASIEWGDSGGPLVNEDGQVLGVISRYAYQDHENAAVHVDYLNGLLISRGIGFIPAQEYVDEPELPVDPPAEEEEEPDVAAPINGDGILGPQGPLIIGLSAGAFLIIVLALLLLSRRRKMASAMATPSVQYAAAAGPVTMTRPEREPEVTQAKRPQHRPVVKCVSGQFFGQTLELVDNQLTIGRDPRLCQLVYPQEREEISRKHVTISFDDRTHKFALVDYSSNGTYLSSNQKLEPGEKYYINDGERFYLAHPNEVFEVKVES